MTSHTVSGPSGVAPLIDGLISLRYLVHQLFLLLAHVAEDVTARKVVPVTLQPDELHAPFILRVLVLFFNLYL